MKLADLRLALLRAGCPGNARLAQSDFDLHLSLLLQEANGTEVCVRMSCEEVQYAATLESVALTFCRKLDEARGLSPRITPE